MHSKHEDSKFKKWLDILQQESWQLELIISGVAILGLFQAFEPIIKITNSVAAKTIGNSTLSTISGIGFAAIIICLLSLTICLIIHVILRGLWIGAVGLRYFSGDIDYEVLNYTDKFKNYLQKRIGSFDKYIAKLEDYCSIIFALSFLLVFFFLSFFITIGVVAALVAIIDGLFGTSVIGEVIGTIILVFMFIAIFLTAFDFFTQGFLKKKKWIGVKRILAVLLPVFIGGLLLFSVNIRESNFHIDRWANRAEYARALNYDDEIVDRESAFVRGAAIPSKIMKESALPIFIKHRIAIEDVIYKIDSTLVPENDERGYESGGINFQFNIESDSTAYPKFQKYIRLLEEVITIKLDDTIIPASYIMSHNLKNQRGYETVLDLKDVSRGMHTLHITRKDQRSDSIITRDVARIPFWYYPD